MGPAPIWLESELNKIIEVRGRYEWEGIYVHKWLIHFVIQQKLTQYYKAAIRQLKKIYIYRAPAWCPQITRELPDAENLHIRCQKYCDRNKIQEEKEAKVGEIPLGDQEPDAWARRNKTLGPAKDLLGAWNSITIAPYKVRARNGPVMDKPK